MISKEKNEHARTNWIKGSFDLCFKLITPYFIEINGNMREVFAFLPEYGSANGTIICLTTSPQFETDREVFQWTKENNVFFSSLNIEDFQIYNEEYIKEILEDWMKC